MMQYIANTFTPVNILYLYSIWFDVLQMLHTSAMTDVIQGNLLKYYFLEVI